jgi:hypothetical protein
VLMLQRLFHPYVSDLICSSFSNILMFGLLILKIKGSDSNALDKILAPKLVE